jgi:hypothetical protein
MQTFADVENSLRAERATGRSGTGKDHGEAGGSRFPLHFAQRSAWSGVLEAGQASTPGTGQSLPRVNLMRDYKGSMRLTWCINYYQR